MIDLRFSGCLKRLFRDVVYRRFQCRSFGSRPMFAAVDNLPVIKIAFEAERLLHRQENEAENIGFGREGLFQKYKVGRVLKRGGKGKAAFGIVAHRWAVKQVMHWDLAVCSKLCRLLFYCLKQPAPRQFFIDCTGAGMRPPRFTNTSQLPSFTGIIGA